MRAPRPLRRRLAAVVAAAMACLAFVPAAPAAPAPSTVAAPPPAPARLFVSADEWSLVLSRLTVKAGPVIVQLGNQGEDEHNLRLRRVGARGKARAASRAVAATPSGRLTEAELNLRRGRWKLWCSLPGHREAGMRATLVVR